MSLVYYFLGHSVVFSTMWRNSIGTPSFIFFFSSMRRRQQLSCPVLMGSKRAQCTSPGQYTPCVKGIVKTPLSYIPIKEIMTSQQLGQHSKIPTTKAKGYILLKKGQRQRQKGLSFLHKGIINNNSFTLALVIN